MQSCTRIVHFGNSWYLVPRCWRPPDPHDPFRRISIKASNWPFVFSSVQSCNRIVQFGNSWYLFQRNIAPGLFISKILGTFYNVPRCWRPPDPHDPFRRILIKATNFRVLQCSPVPGLFISKILGILYLTASSVQSCTRNVHFENSWYLVPHCFFSSVLYQECLFRKFLVLCTSLLLQCSLVPRMFI